MAKNSRLRAAFTVAVCCCVMLTGCKAIPRTSEVKTGLSNLEQVSEQVLFNPAGPLPGASQQDVVRGFIAAASSATNDYEIAREYLTPQYRNNWLPRKSVLIDDGAARPYREIDDSVIAVSVSAIGSVSDAGIFSHRQPEKDPVELRFELEKVSGEWRIASAPAGILLDKATFTAVWSTHYLRFPDSTGEMLQDPRWILNDATAVSTAVETLLGGPSPVFQAAVHSAIPAGTKLTEPVTVENGTAEISFNSKILMLSPTQLNQATDQIAQSLSGFDTVTGFTLTGGGEKLYSGAVQHSEKPPKRRELYALTKDKLTRVVGSEFRGSSQLTEQLLKLKPTAVSLAYDYGTAAALSAGSLYSVTADGATLLDSRDKLIAPSVDKWGVVWSGTKDGSGPLSAFSDDKQLLFKLPDTGGSKLFALRVSADGSRIALLTNTDGKTSLWVAGIVRDKSGKPEGVLKEPVLLGVFDGDPVDCDWLDNDRIVVLHGSDGVISVTLTGQSSFTSSKGTVSGASAVSGDISTSGIRVFTSSGKLFAPQGSSGWTEILSGITVLARRG